MASGIRRMFIFATTTLLLQLSLTLPSARSGEKPRLLYLDIDTGGSYPIELRIAVSGLQNPE